MRFPIQHQLLVAFMATLAACHASAQTYPVKPIRWIVPFPPGGGTDITTRTLAAKLSEALGQQMVIDNRPGSGGTIGLALASKAPADAYHIATVQLANMGIAPALYSKLPYDPVKDFAPITQAVSRRSYWSRIPRFPRIRSRI